MRPRADGVIMAETAVARSASPTKGKSPSTSLMMMWRAACSSASADWALTERSEKPVNDLIASLVEGQEAGCLSLPPFPGETLAIAIRNAFYLAAVGLVSGMSIPEVLAELEACVIRDELRVHVGEMKNNAETGAQTGIVSGVMRNHPDIYPESMTLFMEMAEWRNYEVGFRKIAEGLALGYFRLTDDD